MIVNCWLTVDDARRIYPLDRRERYRAELDAYQNYPTTFRAPLEEHLDELCLHSRSAASSSPRRSSRGEEWDHFFLLFSSPDWLGHYATGRFLRGDPEARAAFLRLYRAARRVRRLVRASRRRTPRSPCSPTTGSARRRCRST